MHEDAIIYCDKALKIDKDHIKSKFRKGNALAFLSRFDESMEVFNTIKYDREHGNMQKQV